MKIRYFPKIAIHYSENQVNNFEKLITDLNSSTPKAFDQTLCKFVILLNSRSLLRKSSQQFRQTDNGFKFLDPDNFSSNIIKTRYFVNIPLHYSENQVNSFEKPIKDSDSSHPENL